MTAINHIVSVVVMAFFVANCGIRGERSETEEQEPAKALDEICEVSSVEDCEASYELLYESNAATTTCGQCISRCKKLCNPPTKVPGCEQSCDNRCKSVCP